MSNITSKTILITGASSGFGRDMAEILTRAGHTVFASMRDVASKHRDQANALRKQGIAVVELGVSNDASVDAAVKRCWRVRTVSTCLSTTPALRQPA
jgi:NAD(P)-dependent dehydrogenase (short-subunit alcohol dehydrogenase family)